MQDRDCQQRFAFEAFPVRGQIVHLDAAWRAVLERHDYPGRLIPVLGEAMAATVLLTSTLKFDGRMTLQVHGQGPLNLLVSQCTHDLSVRGLAKWRETDPAGDFREWIGEGGRLVITVQSDSRPQPYQGVVPLGGASLGECLTGYFESSEQVPTRIWLAANHETAAGLLLQRLPDARGIDDDWNRIQLLAETTRDNELLGLRHEQLLKRLFVEDDLRLFDRRPVQFRCSCSTARIETVLKSLGAAELDAILAEQGRISVDCEFCNRQRRFDAVDVARILAGGPDSGAPDALH